MNHDFPNIDLSKLAAFYAHLRFYFSFVYDIALLKFELEYSNLEFGDKRMSKDNYYSEEKALFDIFFD